MCNSRTNLYKEINDIVQSVYGKEIRVFNTQIPYTVRVGEANFNQMSVIEYEPDNKASIAFIELAKEVL
jgi:chromosome partitioning protein